MTGPLSPPLGPWRKSHGDRNRDDGIDRRVIGNIRFNARRLARQQTVPGMEVEDYEQDLVLDLLHRRKAFDPARASFATFADRVITHRVRTLASPTLRLMEERRTGSLNAPAVDEDGHELTLLDLLPDETPPIDEFCGVQDRRRPLRREPTDAPS